MRPPLQIAVFGAATCDEATAQVASVVGEKLAAAGAHLVCGGRGGVMAAACRGARKAGGVTVGILPGTANDPGANPDLTVRVFTGMGQARNLAVALSGRAAIAIGGRWGTLSEIALALKHGIPVVTLGGWRPTRADGSQVEEPLLHTAHDAEEAVALALLLAAQADDP